MLSGTRDLNDDLELSRLKEELLAAEREHGPESASLIEPLEKLAYRYHSLGLQAEAEDTYKRVLSLREANAEQDINGLISTLHCLAILMRIQSRFAEAEPYYARALELTRQQCGPNHMETATRQNYLAGLYFAWQKFDLAEELVLSSLSIYKENLGEQHELVGIASMGLALICNRQSRIPEANEYFRRASRILPAAPHGSVLLNFRDLAASLLFLSKEKYKQGQIE